MFAIILINITSTRKEDTGWMWAEVLPSDMEEIFVRISPAQTPLIHFKVFWGEERWNSTQANIFIIQADVNILGKNVAKPFYLKLFIQILHETWI